MEKIQAFLKVNFSTKVLLPVVTTMVALLGLITWTVSHLITRQYQTEAARRLAQADTLFQNSQKLYSKNLLLRFLNLPNEPRYRAALMTGDRATLGEQINSLLAEQKDVDVVLFTSHNGELLASAKRDPLVSIGAFEAGSTNAIQLALEGDGKADTILADERLFKIAAIPASGPSGELIGVLTFGSEIGNATAQEFKLITGGEVILLANGRVIASTVSRPELGQDFAGLFNQKQAGERREPKPVALGEEHYFCLSGKFKSIRSDGAIGYLLFTAYEQQLRTLHASQQILIAVSFVGVFLGTLLVWFFVRKITQPLRELRDSAEAVGKGDFSRRVEVISGDECGELAYVFNQMTENLQRSREQLERTVDTLKTTQAQLIQSEKLSGIGEFVAGVAHELNNPLTSVMGFAELLSRTDANPQHKRYMELIQKSAQRCQKIVQSLLTFARRHAPERKLSSVNSLAENAVEFLQYQLRTSNIEVITKLDPHLPQAMVDPHQVQQVFLNIINNARQAIEAHQAKGCIRVTTETCGQTVRVLFQDNGPGISEANLSKVFDPFFTTKEVGNGTGLGLSLCYGIIKEHGGSIIVRSKPGEGAAFVIELPLAAGAGETDEKPPAVGGHTSVAITREGVGKKVLVIDDEDAILEMVRDTLSQSGYEVHTARDGEIGLNRLQKTPYDLTLCDWKMPGLGGQQVYERLHATNPALSERMIFITGDVINEKTQKFLADRKKLCLSKPFSLVEFRAVVAKALARG
jgi:two-component system NtrC family sensor kinase